MAYFTGVIGNTCGYRIGWIDFRNNTYNPILPMGLTAREESIYLKSYEQGYQAAFQAASLENPFNGTRREPVGRFHARKGAGDHQMRRERGTILVVMPVIGDNDLPVYVPKKAAI